VESGGVTISSLSSQKDEKDKSEQMKGLPERKPLTTSVAKNLLKRGMEKGRRSEEGKSCKKYVRRKKRRQSTLGTLLAQKEKGSKKGGCEYKNPKRRSWRRKEVSKL